MDIIFCRNVLMYFVQNVQKDVVKKFYRSLADEGYLAVSPSETSHMLFSPYKTVNSSGITFYQRRGPGLRDQRDADTRPLPTGQAGLTPDLYTEVLSLYELGHYAEAEARLASLPAQKQDGPAMTLLARVYANQGKLSEAIEICEKAILIDKLDPGYHYLLANILQEQGKSEEAAASLKRALYIDQNFVLAHFALGNLSRRQGKFKEAGKYFDNVLSLLGKHRGDEILHESEGLTAGRLREIVETIAGRSRVVPPIGITPPPPAPPLKIRANSRCLKQGKGEL
jgi:chemotaxis protein methyltransferase CheR